MSAGPTNPLDEAGSSSREDEQQQLPFTSDVVTAGDFGRRQSFSSSIDRGAAIRSARPHPTFSNTYLSSSYGQKTPARSFYHHPYQASPELHYSSDGVREQTEELASWALSDSGSIGSTASTKPSRAVYSSIGARIRATSAPDANAVPSEDRRFSADISLPDPIAEVSEPITPQSDTAPSSPWASSSQHAGPLSKTEEADASSVQSKSVTHKTRAGLVRSASSHERSELESLLPKSKPFDPRAGQSYGTAVDLEQQGTYAASVSPKFGDLIAKVKDAARRNWSIAADPKRWTKKSLWDNVVVTPVMALPAVFLGVLLNVLDALSYGMILFPLGEEIFKNTGPDGISIYYVSCIVSQIVYSCGGSVFRGGVGSEMIEVVPFFHRMAYTIISTVGEDRPAAVLATTITSYAASSILTGLVFFALGAFRLGNLVSFFPRSILTGCIGGVGVFLFITGLEVSARLDSNMEYSMQTLQKLLQADTAVLWLPPLALAVLLLVIRHFNSHPIVLPTFFIVVTAVFYFFVAVIPSVTLHGLRQSGWMFQSPESGVPFYRFYSYYDFRLVDWRAVGKVVPTMFALTFFGILHVPINIPALGVAVREDNVHINRELIAHGVSNALSGLVGSVQNYLVYANSVLFIRNGGDSHTAGLMLAAATFGVLVAGPAVIGFIPVMIVGTLIYMLGIELVMEALWDTYGRIQRLEYMMIVAIVLIMGLYDFVVGIVAGIFLACLNYVVQTSQKSAIRATYSGTIAESTVRRHPLQRRFLRQVGPQIYVVKLTGYLFFGTVVAVEKKMRHLTEEETFQRQPIRYLILDFASVTGLDFSAAEAFMRMSRILSRRDIEVVLSSVTLSGEIGKGLLMVGVLDEDKDGQPRRPQVFENLNKALESCENRLLLAFKERIDETAQRHKKQSRPVAVPATGPAVAAPSGAPKEAIISSPRHGMLQRAVTSTLEEQEAMAPARWHNFRQPLPLILQTLHGLSEMNEDFWFRAVPFFERREIPAGTVLYSRGDEPDGFYLLQEGILRSESELEQGSYHESIVAGTTCGELPFFSETDRTGTVVAEKDCVAWLLTRARWKELEAAEPDVARELLKVGLKLTSERMSAITSYVLLSAG